MTGFVIVTMHLLGTGFFNLFAPRRGVPVALTRGNFAVGPAHMGTSPALEFQRDLQKRARHEAAHAVVAHALGHLGLSASVVPDRRSGGRVTWRHKAAALASVDRIAVTFARPTG